MLKISSDLSLFFLSPPFSSPHASRFSSFSLSMQNKEKTPRLRHLVLLHAQQHLPCRRRAHHRLHLHRLEDQHRLTLLHGLSALLHHLEHLARQRRLHPVRRHHRRLPALTRRRRRRRCPRRVRVRGDVLVVRLRGGPCRRLLLRLLQRPLVEQQRRHRRERHLQPGCDAVHVHPHRTHAADLRRQRLYADHPRVLHRRAAPLASGHAAPHAHATQRDAAAADGVLAVEQLHARAVRRQRRRVAQPAQRRQRHRAAARHHRRLQEHVAVRVVVAAASDAHVPRPLQHRAREHPVQPACGHLEDRPHRAPHRTDGVRPPAPDVAQVRRRRRPRGVHRRQRRDADGGSVEEGAAREAPRRRRAACGLRRRKDLDGREGTGGGGGGRRR
eukprot:Rhum_TRINITY_DN14641_c3_g1::Rhum_TRINITY_DN14641_c3_g1_i1::g.103127::m.103127